MTSRDSVEVDAVHSKGDDMKPKQESVIFNALAPEIQRAVLGWKREDFTIEVREYRYVAFPMAFHRKELPMHTFTKKYLVEMLPRQK